MGKIQLIGEKNGVKRNLLTDANGLPLSIVVSAANEHDVTKLVEMIDGRIITPPVETKENLCLDAGYAGKKHKQSVEERNMIPHIRPRGEEISEKQKNPDFKARRWIVEVAHSWFNRFRKILIRFEKKSQNYTALLHLVASIICFRKIGKGEIIYG